MSSNPHWIWFETKAANASWNMAIDEAMLRCSPHLNFPLLRFYSWTEKAATFGYFQKRTDVEQLTELRPLVRRCTGGGLVRHDSDWTYSLAIPATHAWYRLPAEVSYKILHQWIQRSLHRIGVSTQLSPCCAKAIPGACFAGPEKFDLTLEDRKIAGAAQRRSREGLLIQGSLQGLPSQSDRSAWMQAMADCADPALSNPGVKSELPQPVLVEAGGLERGRYTPSSSFQTRR